MLEEGHVLESEGDTDRNSDLKQMLVGCELLSATVSEDAHPVKVRHLEDGSSIDALISA